MLITNNAAWISFDHQRKNEISTQLAPFIDTHRIFMLAAMDSTHESSRQAIDIGISHDTVLGHIIGAEASDIVRCWTEGAVGKNINIFKQKISYR